MRQGYSNDSELWEAFKKGDTRAFELMFKENYEFLINYGSKFNNDSEEVADCVQQLFAGLWESRNRLGSNDFVRGYLLASLRRMILRKNKRNRPFIDLGNLNPKFMLEVAVENGFLRRTYDKERSELVAELIDTLPSRQKEALYLRFYAEQSFSEIGLVMGITTRAVYKLIYKALDKMADLIEQHDEQAKYVLSLAT